MSLNEVYKIYLIGIGGQGTVKTATIIGEAAMDQGLNVVMSEVHGMAQRGGTVITEVKIGNAESPLIEKNSADMILSFEPAELLRVLDKINRETYVITSTTEIIPFTVSLGISEYPDLDQLFSQLNKKINHLYQINAVKLAEEAGHIITANIVLLGIASSVDGFPVKKEAILESIGKNVPASSLEMNLRAFQKGYDYYPATSSKVKKVKP